MNKDWFRKITCNKFKTLVWITYCKIKMSINIAKPSNVLPVIPVHVFNYLCSTVSKWIRWSMLIFWCWYNNKWLTQDKRGWEESSFSKKKKMFFFSSWKLWIFTSPTSDEWRTLSIFMRWKQSPSFDSSPNRFSQMLPSFCLNQKMHNKHRGIWL